MKGFSARNLKYMRALAVAWPDEAIVQRAVARIPWSHNVRILDKVKDPEVRRFYIDQTRVHGWSRDVLLLQIESRLHERQGKALTNFETTLPAHQSGLAQQITKDPYCFHSYLVGGGVGYEATKAVSSGYGPGPTLIEDNYLATDGINVFFGASTAAHNGWIPSDITVRHNHIHKPPEWFGDDNLLIKNSFEIKDAQRVLVERNLFENNWVHAQSGFMILLRAEGEAGVCEDITLRFNHLTNFPSGWSIVGRDENNTARSTRRISIHDNLHTRFAGNTDFTSAGHMIRLDSTPDYPLKELYFTHLTLIETSAYRADGTYPPYDGDLRGADIACLEVLLEGVDLGVYGGHHTLAQDPSSTLGHGAQIQRRLSRDIEALRLSAQYLHSDPVSPEQRGAPQRNLQQALADPGESLGEQGVKLAQEAVLG